MKKIIIVVLFFLIYSGNDVVAQMSDSQIVEYVSSASKSGKSQQSIASELLSRGATVPQLEALLNKVATPKGGLSPIDSKSQQSVLRGEIETEPLNFQFQNVVFVNPNDTMQVYGKNIFNRQNLTFAPSVNIPTPENYTLGAGDEVVIDVWGASQSSIRQTISPEGSIVVDRLGPVFLNGMTVNEANGYVKQKFSTLYSGVEDEGGMFQIKLTLGQIRTIQVSVMGEVVVPGTYSVSSLSSVFHALYSAGGINGIGSLRAIQLYRKGELIKIIDIYEYLLNGDSSGDIRLMDGDMISVPTYISLVNISGKVKRPMYYEMTSYETLADLVKYSGGFVGDSYKDKVKLVRKTGGYDKIYTVASDRYSDFMLSDGDSVFVDSGFGLFENRVKIDGAVYRAGFYEVGSEINTVSQLIEKAGGLTGDAFLDRIILTREREDLTLETVTLNLRQLLSNADHDIKLRKNDILYIPSDNLLSAKGAFSIYGDVVSPGSYEYADNTAIEDLIVKAGGLLNSASMVRVDVARRIINPQGMSSPAIIAETFSFDIKDGLIEDGEKNFTLKPYDQVYIRRSPEYIVQRNVKVEGEVLFPGVYALEKKDMRLSDIIKKAGGRTPQAYTQGARLIRELTDKEIEQKRDAMNHLAFAGENDSISENLMNSEKYRSIGIELDKALENFGSEYDLILKSGDRLIIPEFDNTIKINGAVMYPNIVLYKEGKKVSHYIEQAGGFSDLAEKKRMYVVYMNGTVKKVKTSSKNVIEPGCEIIVPSKVRKEKMTLAEQISIGTSITSMASVVALLINALAK